MKSTSGPACYRVKSKAHATSARAGFGCQSGQVVLFTKTLVDKGLVKMGNFSHNQKKMGFASLLIPGGIKSKDTLTAHSLERNAVEYAVLKNKLKKHEKDIKHLNHSNKIRIAEEAV